MKTVQECLVLVILFCVVYSYLDLRCPYPSERRYRSRWFCNGLSTEKYACLYNSIRKKLEESCRFEPLISGEGKEYQIHVFPDPVSCQNPQRYQPFPLRSNISSECVLLKSTCSDEGQYMFHHGSSTNDQRCGCDFQKGFGFVHKVERQCDCNPSKEDCSCYMKKNNCLSGFKLSSDYTCIHNDNKIHESKCPGFGPDRTRNDTQLFRLHPKNKTEDNGARISKIVPTILTVICIIYVICVLAFLLTNKIPKCLIQEISYPFYLKACQEGCFLKLAWSKESEKEPTNRIQKFKIYYTHNDNWDDYQHEMVAADQLHYYFSKLLPSKTYRFKVAACLNNLMESQCSEEETFVTGLPEQPQYFNAYKHNVEDNRNSCSVLLKWAAPGNTLIDIDNYFIRFTTNNWETCEEKLLPCDIYEYVIQNAQQHVHYLFEIVSISNKVCSIPLNRIYSTKHDTYQSGVEFDVKAYMDFSMDCFKAEFHKLFQDKFNGIPGVQTLLDTCLSKGSITLEFTSDVFVEEEVLKVTLENTFEAGVKGPRKKNFKKFWFKRLHDPLPPQQVTASSINDGVIVSWTEPPSTLFNTTEYTLEFSTDNWICKEEIIVSADSNNYFIKEVLPLTTIYAKVYTCICHSIKSSPSAEVIRVVEGPTPPEILKVIGIEDSIEITWTKPLHPSLDFVKNYKIVIDEGDNTICENVGKDRSSFLKRYCKPFTTYKFRIVTCTVNGLESQQSPVVPIQTNASYSRVKETECQPMNLPEIESVPGLHSVIVLAKEDCETASYSRNRKKEFQPMYMSGIKPELGLDLHSVNVLAAEDCETASFSHISEEFQPMPLPEIESYNESLHELSVTETINKAVEEGSKTDVYHSAAENASWLNIESELRFKQSAKRCRSNSLSYLRSTKEDIKGGNDWFYKLKIQCGKYDIHLILNQTIQTQYTSLAATVNLKDPFTSLIEKLKCSKPFTSAFERMYQLTICTSWITSENNLCEQNELLYRFILAKNWCSLKEVLNLLIQAMEYQMRKLSKAFSWYLLRRMIKQLSISDCLSQVKDVWPGFFCRCSKITKGHAVICSKEAVIVIDADEYLEGLPGEMYGIPVKQSAYYMTTEKTEDINETLIEKNTYSTDDQAVSGKHAQELFLRHTKLTLVYISITDPWCIRLGCQAKGIIPMGEEHLPAVVCSRNTKVLHGNISFMHKHKMHVGSKIGPATKTSWGTLGGFVRRRGRDAFLTCSHVIYDKETLLCGNQRNKNEKEVEVQCYFNDDTNTFICGHVIDDVFDYNKSDKTSIDAAVVLLDSEKYSIDKDEIVQIVDSDLKTSSKPVAFLGMSSPYVNDNYKTHEIKKGVMKARLVGAKSGYFERDVEYEDYDAIKETFKDKRNKPGVIAQWSDMEEQFEKVKAMHPKPLLVATDVHLQTKLIPKLGEAEEQNPRFVRFYHQILMENFPFEKGDSGTCIYIVEDKSHTKASNEANSTGCIGMAIASYSDIRNETMKTIVTPMEAILEALRII